MKFPLFFPKFKAFPVLLLRRPRLPTCQTCGNPLLSKLLANLWVFFAILFPYSPFQSLNLHFLLRNSAPPANSENRFFHLPTQSEKSRFLSATVGLAQDFGLHVTSDHRSSWLLNLFNNESLNSLSPPVSLIINFYVSEQLQPRYPVLVQANIWNECILATYNISLIF